MATLSFAFDRDPELRRLPGNLPVNASAAEPTDISSHNSPTLARNPRRTDQLAVANRVDTPRFSCALHVSGDAGATWRSVAIPVPRGEEPKCYAPDVAFDAGGRLYLTFVTLRGRGNEPNAAWLATSTDGGQTLSTPARVLGPLSFQVRLAADPREPGALLLTWLEASEVGLFRFTQTGNPIMAKRTGDGGATWSVPARVSGSARERVVAGSPAIARDGTLYVLYLDLADDRLDYEGAHGGRGGPPFGGRWKLVLSRSTDDGRSWRERVVEERLVPAERFVVFIPPFPALATDGARVYASFHDGRLGDRDVWLWASGDGGATFDAPVRVNDSPRRDGTAQYLPRLGVAPDGRVDVVYYDRREDPADRLSEVSLQSSFDRGAGFTPRVTLTERPFDSSIGFGRARDLPDLGSRLGLLSTDAAALAVWTDTRAGTPASGKQDIARAVVVISRPPRPAGTATYALRAAALLMVSSGIALMVLVVRRRRRAR